MYINTIYREQSFSVSKNQLWSFISQPANLEKITPGDLGFTILTPQSGTMYPGQLIEYTVKPFGFFALNWITEITHVQEGHYFVDEQRLGPYRLWHHEHFLKEENGKTLMIDKVHYVLPFGIFGKILAPLVQHRLKKIFDFREKKLRILFE
ncbi:MAG: SRPBCC family protein [Flavobacteriales bacterium]